MRNLWREALRLSRSDWKILLAGLLIGLGLGAGILGMTGAGGEAIADFLRVSGESISIMPEVNDPAPDFELENLSGEIVRLSDYRGSPVLLNFWATWCGPCRVEMPVFQQYQDEPGSDLVVLAVNFDEPARDVQAFVDEFGLSFPVLLDPGAKVNNLYRVRSYPTTLFIDPEGVIRYRHFGAISERQIEQYLGELGVLQ
jgi:peroxiredoxin